MRRWAAFAAVLIPFSARAAPPAPEAPNPVVLPIATAELSLSDLNGLTTGGLFGTPLRLSFQASPGTGLDGAAPRFAAPALTSPLVGAAQGWGLFATLPGRSIDFGASGVGWRPDPDARAFEVQAGYGWRDPNLETVIGYSRYDLGPGSQRFRPDSSDTLRPQHEETLGVLGLGLRMRMF